jgi:hypothetical protein
LPEAERKEPLVSLEHITKAFPGVVALDDGAVERSSSSSTE